MAIQVTIDGNVGVVSEMRQTQAGVPVLNFTLAHNHRATNAQGVWETRSTSWFKVAVFGPGAENCLRNFKKGSAVFVEGTLEIEQYKNPSTGAVSVSAIVRADNVGLNMKWAEKSADGSVQTELAVEPKF